MSRGGGGSRVSIPDDVRKTIQNIREITGKQHSDEDVLAMLQDCSMDPNETAQKLLYLDTFHEVKSRRERRKENTNGRSPESNLTLDAQGRAARGNRPRSNHVSSGGGRNLHASRDSRVSNSTERGHLSASLSPQKNKNIPALHMPKTSNAVQSGPSHSSNGVVTQVHQPSSSVNDQAGVPEVKFSDEADKKGSFPPAITNVESKPESTVVIPDSATRAEEVNQTIMSGHLPASATASSAPDVASALDPLSASSVSSHEQVLHQIAHPPSVLSDCGDAMTKSTSVEDDRSLRDVCDPLKVVASKVALDTSKVSSDSLPMSSVSDGQHVTFPNHFHVSEAFKNSLTFGSFDTNLGVRTESINVTDTDDKSSVSAESSEGSDANVQESLSVMTGNIAAHPEASSFAPETVELPSQNKVLSMTNSIYDQAKQNLSSEVTQNPVVQEVPSNNSFSLIPPILGSQFVQLEAAEVQARDVSQPANFINGNAPALSAPSPTPITQTSIAVSPQPIPVYRQPYPLNYFPYGPYLPPFYLPTMHQLIGHNGFTQQPSAGNLYIPQAVTAQGIKYPFPPFKPGSNATPIGIPSTYTAYGSAPLGYNPSAAVTSGTSTVNEDLVATQLKENHHPYSTTQQNEGSAVWIPPLLGQDISSLQVNPLYNLHGPHVTFSPAQPAHGAFGLHQPAQTIAAAPTVHPLLQQSQSGSIESAGLPSGAYQHPQHAQINWNANF